MICSDGRETKCDTPRCILTRPEAIVVQIGLLWFALSQRRHVTWRILCAAHKLLDSSATLLQFVHIYYSKVVAESYLLFVRSLGAAHVRGDRVHVGTVSISGCRVALRN